MPRGTRLARLILAAAFLVTALAAAPAHAVPSATLVISQVYVPANGAGTYNHAYIELFNRGTRSVDLTGRSLQSAVPNQNAYEMTALPGITVAPGKHVLVLEDAHVPGGTGPSPPGADATGSMTLWQSGGTVALVNSTRTLLCSPTFCARDPEVMDLVGYGALYSSAEGTGAPAPSGTSAVLRKLGGCRETDQNSSDFSAGTPTAHNSTAAATPCGSAPTVFEQTLLISRVGPDGPPGDANSGGDNEFPTPGDLTNDGHLASFPTAALNLRPPGVDPQTEPTDIVERDVYRGQNKIMSIKNGPRPSNLQGPLNHGHADSPTVEAAGKVAFVDTAPDLLTPSIPAHKNIWVRSDATGITTRASQVNGASGTDSGVSSNGDAESPSISEDGTKVAFTSTAHELAPGASASYDVFVRDLTNNTTTLVSRANDGGVANGYSFLPNISGNGRYVAYMTTATNIGTCTSPNGGYRVVVRDLAAGAPVASTQVNFGSNAGDTHVCAGVEPQPLAISYDGKRIAFVTLDTAVSEGGSNNDEDVLVWDSDSNTTTLASHADGAFGSGPSGEGGSGNDLSSSYPAMSRDGNLVAFISQATNLGPDHNDFEDVFVRNLNQATTTIASVPNGPTPSAGGVFGNNHADHVLGLTDDGKVLFSSTARNLTPGLDPASRVDVFMRLKVTSPPVNEAPGTVTGDPRVGQQLTCNPGTWKEYPVAFQRQWMTQESGVISGATGFTYTTVSADKDKHVFCRVKATNQAGVSAAADTSALKVLPSGPQNVAPPVMSGTPVLGSKLQCAKGTWQGATTVTQRFVRSTGGGPFVAINGAAGNPPLSYTVTQADIGSRVACQDIAANSTDTTIVTSNFKTPEPGVPQVSQAPVISGSPEVGKQIDCNDGQWSNAPSSFTRRWLRDGAEIGGATGVHYTLTSDDADHSISCEVTATNDVGTGSPSTSAAVFSAAAAPELGGAPTLALEDKPGKATATNKRLVCHGGGWKHDPGADTHSFRIEHEEGGIVEQGATHDVAVADLGRYFVCVETVTNAKGTSEGTSIHKLVPLPTLDQFTGHVVLQHAGGVNRFDPVNLLASPEGLNAELAAAHLKRVQDAYASFTTFCAGQKLPSGKPAKSPFLDTNATTRNVGICQLLRDAKAGAIQVLSDGVHIQNDPSKCYLGEDNPCGALPIPMPTAQKTDESVIDPALVPQLVLWDLDGNGTTDLSCPGNAPVARTIYSAGWYHVQGIIVLPNSLETGVYPGVDDYINHHGALVPPLPEIPVHPPGSFNIQDIANATGGFAVNPIKRGADSFGRVAPPSHTELSHLRKAQPSWCWDTLQPPDIPEKPCAPEGNIGSVHVTGNICPVSLRRIPDEELGSMQNSDPELFAILSKQNDALGARGAAARKRRRMLKAAGLPDVSGVPPIPKTPAEAQDLLQQQFAENVPDVDKLSDGVKSKLDAAGIPTEQAQGIIDQISIVKGDATVDGVLVKAKQTLLLPSDVGEVADSVKKMRIFASSASPFIGKVPVGEPEQVLNSLMNDAVGAGAQELVKNVDLDAIKDKYRDLVDNLDLGPFDLRGNLDVDLEGGQATIHAKAELPLLDNARGGVDITATPDGHLTLSGIHIEVGTAKLGALDLKDVSVDWGQDEGLGLKGKITFPWAGNAGIDIDEFKADNDNHIKSLIIDFLAGAGGGIPVGPGVFLTKLGGGYKDTDAQELQADAALSVGPSAGGGCPTVGADGSMKVHFGPAPFYFNSHVNMQIVCLGLANVDLTVYATGVAHLVAHMDFEGGPLFFNAKLHGDVDIPNWEVGMDAHGGVHLPDPLPDISAGLEVVLSNRGLAGCGSVIGFEGGAGVRWNPDLILGPLAILKNVHLFTGCGMEDFHTVKSAGAAHASRAPASTQPRTFQVARGEKALILSAEGLGAAPRTVLKGPDGTTVDLAGDAAGVKTARTLGMRVEDEDRDLFLVRAPAAGKWTLAPGAGSVPVVRIQRSRMLPQPRVRARVVHRGARYRLSWNVRKMHGQVVRFVEQVAGGAQTVATVKGGGKGSRTFIPAEGIGRKRKIVAEVEQDRLPRAYLPVASFSAPSPRVGRARAVRIRRHGKGAVVTWKPAFYADRYEVTITTSTGRRVLARTGKRGPRVVLKRLGKRESMTARVVGVSPTGRDGPAAKAHLKAPKKKHAHHKKHRARHSRAV